MDHCRGDPIPSRARSPTKSLLGAAPSGAREVRHPQESGSERPQRIAVCGAGISGLSAAWLLSKRHAVTLYEAEPRLGGHTCTVQATTPARDAPVDMGFIVYNEAAYPN